jgi:hypothetical protein
MKAHEAAIRVVALSPRHTSTIKDHSQQLVESLSEHLGRPLPQPAYVENIDGIFTFATPFEKVNSGPSSHLSSDMLLQSASNSKECFMWARVIS